MPNPITNEPISLASITTIISYIATRWGLGFDAATSAAVALVVMGLAGVLARTLSTPLAKHEATVTAAVAGAVQASDATVAAAVAGAVSASVPPPLVGRAATPAEMAAMAAPSALIVPPVVMPTTPV